MKKLFVKLLAVVCGLCLTAGILTACDEAEATTYKVTYQGGEGATGTAPATAEYEEGATFSIAANTFAYEGHTFSVWTDGSADYAAGATYTMPAHDVTFTAKWTPVGDDGGDGGDDTKTQVTLTYSLGEWEQGTPPAAETVDEGTTVQLKTPATRNGYTFTGWLIEGQTYEAGQDYTVNASVQAVAQWRLTIPTTKPAITFKVNEGDETGYSYQLQDEDYSFDGVVGKWTVTFPEFTATELTAPANKTFAGWQTTGDTTVWQPAQTVEVSRATDFFAKWEGDEETGGTETTFTAASPITIEDEYTYVSVTIASVTIDADAFAAVKDESDVLEITLKYRESADGEAQETTGKAYDAEHGIRFNFGTFPMALQIYFKLSADKQTLTLYTTSNDGQSVTYQEKGTLTVGGNTPGPDPQPSVVKKSITFVHGSNAPADAPKNFPDLSEGVVGSTVTVPEITYNIKHYTFTGWNVYRLNNSDWELDSSFGKIANGGSFEMPNYNIQLVSNFTQNYVTISFNANGGSGDPMAEYSAKTYGSKLSVTVGSAAQKFECTYTGPDGAKFLYWSTTADGSKQVEDGFYLTEENGVTEDDKLTLYAIWDKSVPVPDPEPTFTLAEIEGKWTGDPNHILIIKTLDDPTPYDEFAYAIYQKRTTIEVLSIAIDGTTLHAYNSDSEYVTDYTITYADGHLTLQDSDGSEPDVFTAKSNLASTPEDTFTGRYSRNAQLWLIQAGGKAFYTQSGEIKEAVWYVMDEYALIGYVDDFGYTYWFTMKKVNTDLSGTYLAPDHNNQACTMPAAEFYTLTVEGELNQFVKKDANPDAAKLEAAKSGLTIPQGQQFEKWVDAGTNADFNAETPLTADTSIKAQYKAEEAGNTVTYTGSWTLGMSFMAKEYTAFIIDSEAGTVKAIIGGDVTELDVTAVDGVANAWQFQGTDGAKYWIKISDDGNTLKVYDYSSMDDDDDLQATFTKA